MESLAIIVLWVLVGAACIWVLGHAFNDAGTLIHQRWKETFRRHDDEPGSRFEIHDNGENRKPQRIDAAK